MTISCYAIIPNNKSSNRIESFKNFSYIKLLSNKITEISLKTLGILKVLKKVNQ